ncbi:hypothetical protein Adi01nite_74270 [Amorphoplanes digitatis]|nr:hypothetical protein Adi01nite_74270 [Actinoplanes digitatis]
MYDPVALTAEGQRIVEKMVKRGIPYPRARFICLLEPLQADLLVDPLATDINRLVEVLSKQVASSSSVKQSDEQVIRYPFTYGRLLYDKCHDLGFNAKNQISHRETLELLEGTPQGVFQVGNFVTGPYGIIESSHKRFCPPVKWVMYHCADVTCTMLHRHLLETAYDADINEDHSKAAKLLDHEYPDISDWPGYFRRSGMYSGDMYNDFAGDGLADLLGDALSEPELRLFFSKLLNSGPALRETLRKLGGPSGKAGDIASRLDSAQMLQLSLCTSDQEMFAALDALVLAGEIVIPDGEIRVPVVNGLKYTGAFDLQAELSRHGVRIQSEDASLSTLRLRRLVRQMYRFDSEDDRLELAWHLELRHEGTDTLDAVVEQYLRSSTPRHAVSKLLLARRSNFIVAAERLTLADKLMKSDDDRINGVLWKLGFSVEDFRDPHQRFWALHDNLIALTRQTTLRGRVGPDEDDVRSAAVNYFVALEDILKDALMFTTWALTTDHYSSDRRFTYRDEIDAPRALDTLRARAEIEVDADGKPRLTIEDRISLYPMMRGFGLLAKILRAYQGAASQHVRANNRIPEWFKSQELQRFPFGHTVPFLDLLPDSQTDILRTLDHISTRLIGAEVSDARNDWLHSRRDRVETERLRSSLDAVRDAVEAIQDKGFSRQIFRRVRTQRDEAARATVVLSDNRGQELLLLWPSGLGWLGLPGVDLPQHVMTSAQFAEPSEVLRFTTQEESAFAKMWADYPRRPRKSTGPTSSRIYDSAIPSELGD